MNANTITANTIQFMDDIMLKAKDNFQAHPEEVLSNQQIDAYKPYVSMTYTAWNIDQIEYTQEYTVGLQEVVSASMDSKYKLSIEIIVTNQPQETGFSYTVKDFKMKAVVKEKVDGVFLDEPIYTKEYTFNRIITQKFDHVDDGVIDPSGSYKVRFQADGGIIFNTGNGSEYTTYYDKTYTKNQIFGSFDTNPKAKRVSKRFCYLW